DRLEDPHQRNDPGQQDQALHRLATLLGDFAAHNEQGWHAPDGGSVRAADLDATLTKVRAVAWSGNRLERDRKRNLRPRAERVSPHELLGRVGSTPSGAETVDRECDRVGEVAGVACAAPWYTDDPPAQLLGGALEQRRGRSLRVHPRPQALHPRVEPDLVELGRDPG